MFNVSDKVVCINDCFKQDYRISLYNKLPKLGEVYCVREVGFVKPSLPYIKLIGIEAKRTLCEGGKYFEFAFNPERFRKIDRINNVDFNNENNIIEL